MKFLINAANLHCGGGVQVATSFIYELSLMNDIDFDFTVLVSKEIDENLNALKAEVGRFSVYEILNFYGIKPLWAIVNISDFPVVFTVFGPLYLRRKPKVSIMGFAQPWILQLENEVYNRLFFLQKLQIKLKFFLQKKFFNRADILIAEAEHVRKKMTYSGFDNEKIYVVNNCVNSIYFHPEKWTFVNFERNKGNYSIGYITRDYPHKNTDLLLSVKKILMEHYNLSVDFYVTLDKNEWMAKSLEYRDAIYNVGTLNITQCPNFYEKIDAVIFPSYLESFSVTPLEAMIMEKPLFASDRDFVKDICGCYANYFDPNDANNASAVIANYIKCKAGNDCNTLQEARKHANSFPDAHQRAKRYLEIIYSNV